MKKDRYQQYRDEVVPVGKTFGKWTVINNISTKKSKGVLCQCSCGFQKKVYIADLTEGRSTQCLTCSRNEPEYKSKRLKTFKKKSPLSNGDTIHNWIVLEKLIPGGLVKCQCKCGTIRDLQLGNLLSDRTKSCGCIPVFSSKGEQELRDFIKSLGLSCRKKRIENTEIDIFIPDLNIGFEYNGVYWHSEKMGKERKYHLNKTLLCAENGIRLIHIREDLWNNRKEQIKGFIQSALGKNSESIGARKCTINSIPKEEAGVFLDKYHIQGRDNRASLCLGLTYHGQLISLAAFSKHHRNNSSWVLSRFVCRRGTSVPGALSKLSKIGTVKVNSDLISWADRNISQGKGYIQAGWEIDDVLGPDYVYVKGSQVVSKQSRKKSNVNTPPGMTEKEHAELEGWSRIWDCGKIRLTFPKK